jgi:hypothetical protein
MNDEELTYPKYKAQLELIKISKHQSRCKCRKKEITEEEFLNAIQECYEKESALHQAWYESRLKNYNKINQ